MARQSVEPSNNGRNAEVKDPSILVLAGEYWPDSRWDQRVTEELLNLLCPEFMQSSVKESKGKKKPRNNEDFLGIACSTHLSSAGKSWPDSRWDPRIAEALLEYGEGMDLYFAGRDWPDSRWDPRIAEKLAESGSSKDINDASREWPEDRLEVLRDALRRTKARFG